MQVDYNRIRDEEAMIGRVPQQMGKRGELATQRGDKRFERGGAANRRPLGDRNTDADHLGLLRTAALLYQEQLNTLFRINAASTYRESFDAAMPRPPLLEVVEGHRGRAGDLLDEQGSHYGCRVKKRSMGIDGLVVQGGGPIARAQRARNGGGRRRCR